MARNKEFDIDEAIDKAIEIFWERGYKNTSMHDLIDKLGIGKGSFYNTFESKHSLFLLALDKYSNIMIQYADKILHEKPVKSAIGNLFNVLIESIVNDKNQRGCMITNASTEMSSFDDEVSKCVNMHYERSLKSFIDVLLLAVDDGEISKDKDINAIALFLINTMDGLRVMAKRNTDKLSLDSIVETAFSIL